MFCIANISAPPTFNLLGEVVAVIGVFNLRRILVFELGLLVFFGGAYTLVLYASSQHGQTKFVTQAYNAFLVKDHQVIVILALPIFVMVLAITRILFYYKTI